MIAAAVQGLIFGLVRAAVDRGQAQGISRRLTDEDPS